MKSRIVVGGDASSPGPGDYEVVPGIGYACLLGRLVVCVMSCGVFKFFKLTLCDVIRWRACVCRKQVTKRNYPEFSMTGRPAVRMADDMPGPGEHETAVPAAGKQPLSTHPSAPTYSLGARRFIKVKDEADALGPGVCRTDGAFGKQPYSVKRSAPTYTFGARTPAGFSPVRSKVRAPFPLSSLGHHGHPWVTVVVVPIVTLCVWWLCVTCLAVCAQNPGPGAHNVAPAAVGVQVNSRIRTSPAFSLSSRPRVIVDRSAPGPGAWSVASCYVCACLVYLFVCLFVCLLILFLVCCFVFVPLICVRLCLCLRACPFRSLRGRGCDRVRAAAATCMIAVGRC